ncbi:MAG: hypothetical protein IPJ88_16410 [Myxococcales bacterium]|nr:MAG: hypothetical protein IPJ88_16410 [Myxococcales bacterium]
MSSLYRFFLVAILSAAALHCSDDSSSSNNDAGMDSAVSDSDVTGDGSVLSDSGNAADFCGDTSSIEAFFTSNDGVIAMVYDDGNGSLGTHYETSQSSYGMDIMASTVLGNGINIVDGASQNPLYAYNASTDTFEDSVNEVNVNFNDYQNQLNYKGLVQCDRSTQTWTLLIGVQNDAMNWARLVSQ